MDVNAIKAQFPGYAGWNDTAAILADFKATGGAGKGSSGGGGGSTDPVEQARKLRQFNIESNQPHIASLEQQIPETQQRFSTDKTRLEGEKQPLQERYKSLLDDLKNRETQQIGAAQTSAAREFGRRGVPLSSTDYDKYLSGQVNPIGQNFATLTTQTVQDREAGIRSIDDLISKLTGQETEAVRGVQNMIGQLKSGDPVSAIQGALQMLQQAEQQRQFNIQQALAQEQFTFQKNQASMPKPTSLSDQYMALGEGQSLFNLLTGQPMYKNDKTYKPSDSFGAGDWG
jgi:hypothetical protein